MSFRELFTSKVPSFAGTQLGFEESDYVIIGVPIDDTSTFRPGSRFAPQAIRYASLNIESYSFRAEKDIEELKIHDSGDLHKIGKINEMLNRLEIITDEIICAGKIPGFIGGEHTLTLGVTKGIRKSFGMLCFDAHLDLRTELLGESISHATVMRRISESIESIKIVEIGIRSACRDEIKYAEEQAISYLTMHEISKLGLDATTKNIQSMFEECDKIYLSIDLDVLDPAFAPAVQNPEPEGLTTHQLLELLFRICDKRVLGFDVTEVTPLYDNGLTAIQAAKIISEVLIYINKNMS